ncbi:hypothetical protein LO80_04680 [Candidatus Francisella endociliophora]|uniref:Major facilitator superfamily (MFS) profile domain-containing protein n=1 Tax=Candidatus Francisella endociliophora TaxID=653937 RepID=A0A097EP43_9GAMM|nr:MFS transporter [Francisella sp. FSC1006]AIT09332.1 hypothetical protein LO80_04680 [Francisella sp. FSC1006]
MTSLRTKLIKFTIVYTFFSLAMFTSVLSTFILQATHYYHVSNASAGTLESYQNITQVLLSFIAFSILLKGGYRNTMLVILVLMTLTCISMPFLDYYWILKLYLVFLGFALVFLKIGVYSSIGLVTNSQEQHASFVSVVETSWMIASMIGMWVLSFFLHHINWLYAFWIFAGFGIVNIALWLLSPLNESALEKEKNKKISEQFKEIGQFCKSKYILMFIAMAFIAGLVEQGIFAWLPSFYRDVVDLPGSYSVQLASAFVLCMALGRIITIALLKVLRWDRILFLNYIFGVVFLLFCLGLIQQQTHVISSWSEVHIEAFLLPLIGIFIAPTSPLLNSTILSSYDKAQHSLVMTIITISGALTGSIAARLLGELFDVLPGITAFKISTIIPLVIVAIAILPYAKVINKKNAKTH